MQSAVPAVPIKLINQALLMAGRRRCGTESTGRAAGGAAGGGHRALQGVPGGDSSHPTDQWALIGLETSTNRGISRAADSPTGPEVRLPITTGNGGLLLRQRRCFPLSRGVCVTWGRFTCLCRVFRRIGRAALQLLPLAAFLGGYVDLYGGKKKSPMWKGAACRHPARGNGVPARAAWWLSWC